MTKPMDRPRAVPVQEPAYPELYTREGALELARRTMRCETCMWATRPGDECAEKEFVLGCIHWRGRG